MTTITLTPPAAGRLAGLGRMLGNETAKGLRILWSHKIVLVPQLANMAVLYLMFQLVIGGGRLVDELLPATVVAFSIYVVSYIGLLKMVAGLMEEVNAGTLEQTHLSPLRAWQLSVGRLGAVLTEGLLTAVLLGAGFTLALGIDLPVEPAALVPIAVTLADIAGFILVIGGLALVVGSIGAIVHVINNLIMLVNGSVLPITAFPPALETIAKFVPTTLGIDATRRVLFDNASLATLWTNGSLDAIGAVVGQGVGYGLLALRYTDPVPDAAEPESNLQRIRRITRTLPVDVPDPLVELAVDLTSECDTDRCFAISIDALLAGLEPEPA